MQKIQLKQHLRYAYSNKNSMLNHTKWPKHASFSKPKNPLPDRPDLFLYASLNSVFYSLNNSNQKLWPVCAWKKTSVRTGSIKWNCSSAAAAIRITMGTKTFWSRIWIVTNFMKLLKFAGFISFKNKKIPFKLAIYVISKTIQKVF